MRKAWVLMGMLVGLAVQPLAGGATSAGARSGFEGGTGQVVEIAFFYKLDRSAHFPREVPGNVEALLHALAPMANYVSLAQIIGVKGHDVVSLHNNLLRKDASQQAGYGDYGLDCDLSLRVRATQGSGKEHALSMAGTCNVFMVDPKTHAQIQDEIVIRPTELPDTDYGAREKWLLIFEDAKGLGMYAKARNL